jgi:O-antigen/teichoic acid export membrane protein
MLQREYGMEEAAPRKMLGRASLAGGGTVYQQGISFLSGMIVARVIGAAEYGVYNLARSLMDVMLIMTRLGLEIGLQRFLGETGAASDRTHRLVVLRQLRIIAAVVALIPGILIGLGLGRVVQNHVYHYTGFAQVLLCLALALPFATDLAVLGGAYRGALRLGPSVLAESMLMPTIRLILTVVLFALGLRLWAVVIGTAAASLIASAFLALRAHRDFGAPPLRVAGHATSWAEARRVIRYSIVLAAAVLITTLTSSMDVFMLGHFAPSADLGRYTLAKTLVILIGLGAAAFNQSLGALVANRYFRGDLPGMLQVMSSAIRWIALGTLPALAVFVFWGSQLIQVFGASFSISSGVISVLAAGQSAQAVFGPAGWALSMTGRHVLELKILVAGLLLSIVLCLLMVPRMGQMGAALAICSAITATNLLRLLCIRRTLRALPYDITLLLGAVATLGLAWITRTLVDWFIAPGILSTALGIGLFLLVYAAVCWKRLRAVLLGSGIQAVAGHV